MYSCNHPNGGAYSFDLGNELLLIGRPGRLAVSGYACGELSCSVVGIYTLQGKLREALCFSGARARMIDAFQDLVTQTSGLVRNIDHVIEQLSFRLGQEILAHVIEKEDASSRAGAVGTLDDVTLERLSTSVASMGAVEKLVEVAKRVPSYLAPAIAEEFRTLLAPASLAIMAVSLIAMGAVAATGIGTGIILAVGFFFILWAIFDAASALIEFFKLYSGATSEEDLDQAAEALARFVAVLGVGTLIAFLTKGASRAAQKGGAKVEEAIEQARKRDQQTKTDAERNQTAIVNPARQREVPCFNRPNGVDPKEFARQVREQQDTINAMTADDMGYAQSVLDQARKAWEAGGKKGSSTDLIRDTSAQKAVRQQLIEDLRGMNMSERDIKAYMDTVAATHDLDLIAGGRPAEVGIGDKKVNSSLGPAWKGERVKVLRDQATEMRAGGAGDKKMNVKLSVCP